MESLELCPFALARTICASKPAPLKRLPPLFNMETDKNEEPLSKEETEKLIDEIIAMFEDIAAKTKGK